MKIAIVGAGAAGLEALRHSLKDGHDCEIFEKTENVGGTWVFTENTGIDSYGLPIHSSMYSRLKTNLPKELMAFEGFPYKKPEHSFITQLEVLNYINDFVEKFNLLPHIKFLSHVVEISPISQNRWLVKVENLKTRNREEKEFDAIFVSVGNYSVPMVPKFLGIEKFRGRVIHSHAYRFSETYRNRKVLIIGAGPSGVDIAAILSEVAKQVIIACRADPNFLNLSSKNIIVKPEVLEFGEKFVKFDDNTDETIDDIILCTGYRYTYPFLTPECGIEVENNHVKYLYKDLINVKFPSMAILGIPYRILPFPIFGIQVRFFLAFLARKFTVTQEEMMNDTMQGIEDKKKRGLPLHHYHRLGMKQDQYAEDLAGIAGIKGTPPVIFRLYKYHHDVVKLDRCRNYRIVNNDEFIEITIKKS